MPGDKSDLRLFGLTLDLKVNVLAFIAFLLSIGSLMLQGAQMLRGANVVMSTGERVNFVRRAHPAQPEAPYLVVNARLDYVNTGAVGRDSIVSGERVLIGFGALVPYEYRWIHFELFVPNETGGAKAVTSDVAHSFPVPGAGAATHQTTFVAFPDADTQVPGAKAAPVLWNDFLRLIETNRPVTLRFIAMDRRRNEYESTCTVAVTDPVLEALRRNNWATALCEVNPPAKRSAKTVSNTPPTPPDARPPTNLK